MRYVRLKADSAGESHIEQVTLDLSEADYRPPAPMLFVSHSYRADGLQFVRLPSGWTGESIHPPKAQFFICLKGHLEVTASDGDKRTFGPGDSIFDGGYLWQRSSHAREGYRRVPCSDYSDYCWLIYGGQ